MFTFKYIRYALMALVAFGAASCISNDLPYPWIMPNVEGFEVESVDAEGHELLSGRVEIDSVESTITIPLTEWANIKAVKVVKCELSDGSTCVDANVFSKPLDLSKPLEVEFEKYERKITWTIIGVQPIERYFKVSSQIGSSIIDVENRTIRALVPEGQNMEKIHVNEIKLGTYNSTMTPNLTGENVDFTEPVAVDLDEYGDVTSWTITVEPTSVTVFIDQVDAWTRVAWVYGSAEVGKKNGFEYRQADSDLWIEVPQEDITHDGGSFKACIKGLEPQSQYVVRASSDEEYSADANFSTEYEVQLPNNTFTNWWKDGKVWDPWSETGSSFWDTGNRGAATLGQSNSTPIEDPSSPTGYAGASLLTKFIGISVAGKLGAGNIFAGSYVKTDGTNGILSFGREFNMRPTGVKVRLKYTTAAITDASKSNPDFTYMIGEPDTCIVWCALVDCDEPVEIRTKPADRKLFDRNDSYVIAYGQFQSGKSIEQYQDITFYLDYNATDRVPRYILLTSAASKYGDYFTGGRGAELFVKSIELLYDY